MWDAACPRPALGDGDLDATMRPMSRSRFTTNDLLAAAVLGGMLHAMSHVEIYWQCDDCHTRSANKYWSVEDAKSDPAIETHKRQQPHHTHHAFVADASDDDGTTFYWQCDTCHMQGMEHTSMSDARADKSYQPIHNGHQISLVANAS
ncbi:MAG TPA: hypothetical protein VFC00_17905 [Micromonosporaceae bacterium]|nr:hypothetical protein [Micromonosporaceae bacterium]